MLKLTFNLIRGSLYRVVQKAIIKPHFGGVIRGGTVQAPRYLSPMNGTEAHRARFAACVYFAIIQTPLAELSARITNCNYLCVCCRVVGLKDAIVSTRDDHSVANNYSPEWPSLAKRDTCLRIENDSFIPSLFGVRILETCRSVHAEDKRGTRKRTARCLVYGNLHELLFR